MHICTVATLCFPEKTFPRNYYYCVQDENSLCLCFKNMYRTLFVAIFTSTFIFSMYDHIGLPGCVFPYLSKYKYQQSYISSYIKVLLLHNIANIYISVTQNLLNIFPSCRGKQLDPKRLIFLAGPPLFSTEMKHVNEPIGAAVP